MSRAYGKDHSAQSDRFAVEAFERRVLLDATELVTNGSFEQPVGNHYVAPGEIYGGWRAGGSGIDITGSWQAAHGIQSVDLNGNDPGSANQILQTVPGGQHLLRFALAGNPDGGPAIKDLSVNFGQLHVATLSFDITGHTRQSMGWTYYEFPVSTPESQTELTFLSLTPGEAGPAIDDVSVVFGAPPTVTNASFQYAVAPHGVEVMFSEDVSASLSVDDVAVQNLTTGFGVPAGAMNLSYDLPTNTATLTFPGITGSVLTDGNYRLTLLAAGISDPKGFRLDGDGNGLPGGNFLFDFFFLMADADHDRRVNLNDFNILAANFGQSPRDFTQGDFNYDTIVNLVDFDLLAARFGQSLFADRAVASNPFAQLPLFGTTEAIALFDENSGSARDHHDDVLSRTLS